VGRYQVVEHITYTCEAEGCNKERTSLLSTYRCNAKHYCSLDCKFEASRTRTLEVSGDCSRCETPLLDSDFYMSSSTISSTCKKCRHDAHVKSVEEKKRNQRKVAEEFKEYWRVNAGYRKD